MFIKKIYTKYLYKNFLIHCIHYHSIKSIKFTFAYFCTNILLTDIVSYRFVKKKISNPYQWGHPDPLGATEPIESQF